MAEEKPGGTEGSELVSEELARKVGISGEFKNYGFIGIKALLRTFDVGRLGGSNG